MSFGLIIGDLQFENVGAAVVYFRGLQQRMFDRREMLNATGKSEEDADEPGETFNMMLSLYTQYMLIRRTPTPKPDGFYARRSYPVEGSKEALEGKAGLIMAAYFAGKGRGTEQLFDVGRMIRTVAQAAGAAA